MPNYRMRDKGTEFLQTGSVSFTAGSNAFLPNKAPVQAAPRQAAMRFYRLLLG
jgi:hypothetical protein